MHWKSRRGTLPKAAMLAALAGLPLVACSDTETPTDPNGAEEGTMEAVVRDGPTAAEASPHLGADEAFADVSGQFEADARVQVEVDGTWQDVQGLSNAQVNAELGGHEDESVGSASVEARTYDRVRIVMSNARADVAAGSQIGIGPIEVDVAIQIGNGGDVVVELASPVTVEADGTTRLVLDLNSHLWLDQESVETETVASGEFESAAALSVD